MRLRIPVMAVPLGLWLSVGTSGRAADSCADLVPVLPAERDMETHLRQARHFKRKGWLDDAVKEIAMAWSTPEGRQDPAYALSAQLARETDDIGARCLAKAVIELRRSGESTEQARALLRELDRTFGYLTIYTSGDATTATLWSRLRSCLAPAELGPCGAQVTSWRAVTRSRCRSHRPASTPSMGSPSPCCPARHRIPPRTPVAPALLGIPVVRLRTGAEFRPEQDHAPPPVVQLRLVCDLAGAPWATGFLHPTSCWRHHQWSRLGAARCPLEETSAEWSPGSGSPTTASTFTSMLHSAGPGSVASASTASSTAAPAPPSLPASPPTAAQSRSA